MDEACVDCHELFQTEKKNGATGGYCRTTNDRHIAELLYQKRAEKLLADENCFKLFIYHQSGKMSFELLDTESEAHNSDQVCSILDDDLYDLPSLQLICYYRSCSELKTVIEFSLRCL